MFCLFIILFPFLFRPLLLLTVKSHLRPFSELHRKIWPGVTLKMAVPRQIVQLLNRCLLCMGSVGAKNRGKTTDYLVTDTRQTSNGSGAGHR